MILEVIVKKLPTIRHTLEYLQTLYISITLLKFQI